VGHRRYYTVIPFIKLSKLNKLNSIIFLNAHVVGKTRKRTKKKTKIQVEESGIREGPFCNIQGVGDIVTLPGCVPWEFPQIQILFFFCSIVD
jgi:hypothetical protein